MDFALDHIKIASFTLSTGRSMQIAKQDAPKEAGADEGLQNAKLEASKERGGRWPAERQTGCPPSGTPVVLWFVRAGTSRQQEQRRQSYNLE